MHPLEFEIETKYGKKVVSGLLASEAKNGKVAEVIKFVEQTLDDIKSSSYNSSEFVIQKEYAP